MGFPFSSGDVLTAADLNAIGDWTSFTPTFHNVTLGASGAVTGRYAVVNDLVFYTVKFDLASTGSISGQISFDLPVANGDTSNTYATSHMGWVRPAGSTLYHSMGYSAGSTNRVFTYVYITSGTYSNIRHTDASVPITWTSAGSGYWAGWYATT